MTPYIETEMARSPVRILQPQISPSSLFTGSHAEQPMGTVNYTMDPDGCVQVQNSLNVPKLSLNNTGNSKAKCIVPVTGNRIPKQGALPGSVVITPPELGTRPPPNGYLPHDMSHSRQTSNLSRLDDTRSSKLSVPLKDKTVSTVAEENMRNVSLLCRGKKVSRKWTSSSPAAGALPQDHRLINLAILFLGSTVMTILCLQLLYHVEGTMYSQPVQSEVTPRQHSILRKTSAVFLCVAIILDLCSVVVSSMQVLCAVRLLLTRPCPDLR